VAEKAAKGFDHDDRGALVTPEWLDVYRAI